MNDPVQRGGLLKLVVAGGLLVAGAVYIFGGRRFYPILRPAILTAYLGYLLVVGGLLVDLRRSYIIWHPVIYWQHRSLMFELAWCVTLYNVVLTLEFLPILFEKLRWLRAWRPPLFEHHYAGDPPPAPAGRSTLEPRRHAAA